MALFTGKGDKGTTGLFSRKGGQASGLGCDQRVSKSSAIAEALGSLDEINSFLGLIKVKAKESELRVTSQELRMDEIVNEIQQNLFIIQAEVAGADKTINEEKLREVESLINTIEKELPPIKSFFVSGGTELASLFDIARTMARRAERRVTAVIENEDRKVGEWTRSYLNRLSSILYALARLSNHKSGIKEQPPTYR
ncbi:MAG: cob(I)yrinic acid a,c-diamide adenosyltransferase [Patescibacteria group bacterium]